VACQGLRQVSNRERPHGFAQTGGRSGGPQKGTAPQMAGDPRRQDVAL
jgi:hypothetical protein